VPLITIPDVNFLVDCVGHSLTELSTPIFCHV